ncbi:MAG: DUF4364 family protein [Lachnospiraceae bacterium]|nr:DUF4364 family protein [Lachnospiraceae bacterium]
MLADSLKLYKLIILYFLYRSKQEITNAVLSDFILEHGYTDYLSIQETLSSLTEDQMIEPHRTHTATYYTITENGLETLEFFNSRLPFDTKMQIEGYLKEKKMQIVQDATIRTDYRKTDSGEYLTDCKVIEQKRILFELKLILPTEKMAEQACEKFKEKETDIYAFLWKNLVSDGQKKDRE